MASWPPVRPDLDYTARSLSSLNHAKTSSNYKRTVEVKEVVLSSCNDILVIYYKNWFFNGSLVIWHFFDIFGSDCTAVSLNLNKNSKALFKIVKFLNVSDSATSNHQ